MRRSSIWGAIVIVGVIVGGLAWVIGTVAEFVTTYRNPLDKNWVIDIVTDPRSNRHAVVAKYHHGNSSSTLTGLWIVNGTAPQVGSTGLLDGRPVAIWWAVAQVTDIGWSKRGRIVLTATRPADVTGDFAYCYFSAPDSSNPICAKPELVDIVLIP